MILEREQLEQLLPHRPPILMLDRVVDVVPRIRGTGMKRFEEGESYFEGHFPGKPVLPGIFSIEALAQTAMSVFLADAVAGRKEPGFGLLGKVNEMAFLEPIVPGDEVAFAIEIDRTVGPFAFVSGRVTIDDRDVARGKFTVKIEDKSNS